MDFGVVLQTNPPAWRGRRADEASRAARLHARVDVRLAPAVAGAVRHLQPDAVGDAQDRRRPDGHEPGDPRLDRHRVAVRDAERDVRQPHDLRHRTRRLRGARHQRQADHARDAARRDRRDPRARERRSGRVQGERAAVPVELRQPARRLGRGLRTQSARARPARSATASSSSSPIPTSPRGASRRCGSAAEAAGRDPRAGEDLRRRARLRGRRPRRTNAISAAGSAAWSATTSPTSSPATARDGAEIPAALTDYIQGRRATTTTSTVGPGTRTPTSSPTT